MVKSTNMFMDALEKWFKAVRADDFSTARAQARNIVRNGEMLAIHPDFVRCFTEHYPELEPKQALRCLCQFLVCATDGRARVLKQWVEETQPEDSRRGPSSAS